MFSVRLWYSISNSSEVGNDDAEIVQIDLHGATGGNDGMGDSLRAHPVEAVKEEFLERKPVAVGEIGNPVGCQKGHIAVA